MFYIKGVSTIKDVAKLAGVSPTTVRRAVGSPQSLAPQTLERVEQAIAKLRYVPDLTAGALRRGRSHVIGLIVGSLVEPFFASITRAIGKAARSHDYSLLVADSEYQTEIERKNLLAFSGQRISGLIIRPANLGKPNHLLLDHLHQRGVPIVQIDYSYPNSPYSHVILDNEQCMMDIIRYLSSLGHRRIAVLGMYDPVKAPEERSKVFPEAMRVAGLVIPEDYRKYIDYSEGETFQLTRYLMKLPEAPTALIAINGTSAMGALKALNTLGLQIPTDVSFVSFDNYSWTTLLNPPLDVIEQPVEEMGRVAVQIVLPALGGAGARIVETRKFAGKLLKRGSCTSPKQV